MKIHKIENEAKVSFSLLYHKNQKYFVKNRKKTSYPHDSVPIIGPNLRK
jgi:hypothetical protein